MCIRDRLCAVALRASLVNIYGEAEAAAVQPYQAAELLRRVVSGVHLSQELTQEARRRCLLPAQARDIEIERDIAYARCV